ncbi:hypothetical protein PALU110988_21980 [Paenibacillus lupini]
MFDSIYQRTVLPELSAAATVNEAKGIDATTSNRLHSSAKILLDMLYLP